jgi:hypothetical protein
VRSCPQRLASVFGRAFPGNARFPLPSQAPSSMAGGLSMIFFREDAKEREKQGLTSVCLVS